MNLMLLNSYNKLSSIAQSDFLHTYWGTTRVCQNGELHTQTANCGTFEETIKD